MRDKIILLGIACVIALLAAAVIKPNLDCRRANLNEKAASVFIEGVYLAQSDYHRRHGKYANDVSGLNFPGHLNERLRGFGELYVVNESSRKLAGNGEYTKFFNMHQYTDIRRQVYFLLLVPTVSNGGFVCWLFLDYPGKKGQIVLAGAGLELDAAGILSDPRKFVNSTSSDFVREQRMLELD